MLVGEPGRGIRTIIDMVQSNRYWCCASSAALMRQSLVQAVHHTTHRYAFQKRLIDQPLMRNVLADLALEAEAALTLTLRIGRAMDDASTGDAASGALARIGTAIGKYWICKRAPGHTAEALECLGGPGYVEDSMMPRLYREAPLNSIWEGSGNVMCLDVLRAMHREPGAVPALLDEVSVVRGAHPDLDRAIARLDAELADRNALEARARAVTELAALTWQAALLVQHAPSGIGNAFCASRLGGGFAGAYGALPADIDFSAIIERTGLG